MKDYNCDTCGTVIEVDDDYEPEFCCYSISSLCGCHGYPINPVFCLKCESKIFDTNCPGCGTAYEVENGQRTCMNHNCDYWAD